MPAVACGFRSAARGVPSWAVSPDTTPEHPVLACYRGPDSSGAVQLGSLLAATLRQPLALASAYRYEPVALSAQATPSPANEIRSDAAQAGVERAASLVPDGIEVHEHVVPSEGISEALTGLAREVDACALVVGRDWDGHVTRALLQHAPCPVAVSPLSVPVPEPQPLRVIGVAYDASPAARLALAAAMHLARLARAQVEVIAVGADIERTSLEADRLAAPWSEIMTTKVCVLDGKPAAALVDVSDVLDLLVCGSRGRGRALSALLGSVSTHLVEEAHCPVLVIPSGVRVRAAKPLGLTTAAD